MNKLCETGNKRKMQLILQQFQYRRPAIPPEEANAEGKWPAVDGVDPAVGAFPRRLLLQAIEWLA